MAYADEQAGEHCERVSTASGRASKWPLQAQADESDENRRANGQWFESPSCNPPNDSGPLRRTRLGMGASVWPLRANERAYERYDCEQMRIMKAEVRMANDLKVFFPKISNFES